MFEIVISVALYVGALVYLLAAASVGIGVQDRKRPMAPITRAFICSTL